VNPSAWKNSLLEVGRALALILALVSVLAAGAAHAHVEGAQAGLAATTVVASPNHATIGAAADANAMPSHCSTVASCHTLFLVGAPYTTFESESEGALTLPLHYSAPLAPVFGLFRPPRRG
jgi:hypothetical protein